MCVRIFKDLKYGCDDCVAVIAPFPASSLRQSPHYLNHRYGYETRIKASSRKISYALFIKSAVSMCVAHKERGLTRSSSTLERSNYQGHTKL